MIGGGVFLLLLGAVIGQGAWSILHRTTPWVDRSGGTTVAVSDVQGARNSCGYSSLTFLSFRGRTYLRDPQGMARPYEAEPYVAATALPADARFTGYSKGTWRLYVSPSDTRAVFIKTADGDERWPLESTEFGCA